MSEYRKPSSFTIKELQIDDTLIHIIQQFTQHSTEEILANLYEDLTTMVSCTLQATRAKSLNKNANFFYKKDKRIPVRINIYSYDFDYHMRHNESQPLNVHAKIFFPISMRTYDAKWVKELQNERFEKSIGLRDDVTKLRNIQPPKTVIPRGLKGVL